MKPDTDPESVPEVVEVDPMEWEDPGLLEKRDDPRPEDLRQR